MRFINRLFLKSAFLMSVVAPFAINPPRSSWYD